MLRDGIDVEDSVGEGRETRGAAVSCCRFMHAVAYFSSFLDVFDGILMRICPLEILIIIIKNMFMKCIIIIISCCCW